VLDLKPSGKTWANSRAVKVLSDLDAELYPVSTPSFYPSFSMLVGRPGRSGLSSSKEDYNYRNAD